MEVEEPKPALPTAQTLPTQPPLSSPATSKKRPLESDVHFQNSNYFKIRAVLKDIRPHFIEVLQTPAFQNCKAAYEIREKMKHMMDLYKEMTAEMITLEKCKNVQVAEPLSDDIQDGQKPKEQQQGVKPAELPSPDRVFLKPSEDKPVQGTYIVGGSAFGWNFITFPGNKSVYYGRTKETFRSTNVLSH